MTQQKFPAKLTK